MAETVVVQGDAEETDDALTSTDVSEAAGSATAHAEHAASDAADATAAADEASAAAAHSAVNVDQAAEHGESAAAAADESAAAAQAALTAEAHMIAMIEALPERIAEAVHARSAAANQETHKSRPRPAPAKPGSTHFLFKRVGGKKRG